MKRQLAYIDEYGDSNLDIDKTGVSSHFIVTAIIIDEERLAEVEGLVEVVRAKFFQTGEMKSKNVSSNDARRIEILKELSKIDFHILSVIIDKSRLVSEGYKYKETFYKNLPGIILRELIKTYPEIKIAYDEHGRKEFMDSFVKYVQNKVQKDLFDNYELSFSNSNSQLLIQVADIISGTLARCYDVKKLSPSAQVFISILKNQIIELREWPFPQTAPYFYNYLKEPAEEFDMDIYKFSVSCAENFITTNGSKTDTITKDQVAFLRFLLFNLKYIDARNYVPTWDILNNINQGRHAKMEIIQLRNKVVGRIRDASIIVCSSNRGYKLPANKKDIYDFLNYSNRIIQPMVSRILKCRNEIFRLSKKELDVLDHQEYRNLKKLVE